MTGAFDAAFSPADRGGLDMTSKGADIIPFERGGAPAESDAAARGTPPAGETSPASVKNKSSTSCMNGGA